MNTDAMQKISYGLYVLTACENGFDNGCIINTVSQITSSPNRISITVNKANKTHDMILATGAFNVSTLSVKANFDVFEKFGFKSGKDTDKFNDYAFAKRGENGIYYLTENTNSFIGAKVVSALDLGTHTLFIADVTECEVLSEEESMTYSYYHANVKPKTKSKTASKVYYRCKICGYIYEGDDLPNDFICPLCKHPASDFERIEEG